MDVVENHDADWLGAELEGLPTDEGKRLCNRILAQTAIRSLPIAVPYLLESDAAKTRLWSPTSAFCSALIALSNSTRTPYHIRDGGRFSKWLLNMVPSANNLPKAPIEVRIEHSGRFATRALAFSVPSEYITSEQQACLAAVRNCAIAHETVDLDFWTSFRDNFDKLRDFNLPLDFSLTPISFWDTAKSHLSGAEDHWDIWIQWYERVIADENWHPEKMREVLLGIRENLWQSGPAEINAKFDEVLELYEAEDQAKVSNLVEVPKRSSAEDVERTRTAIVKHRKQIPPTLDGIFGLIELEIERLQCRNYRNEDDRDEAVRQIQVLTSIFEAIEGLSVLIPDDDVMPDADAEKAEGLVRLFSRKFAEWPRANADELVDNTYRFGLIGLIATAAPMIGISASVAAAGGAAFFGGKKLIDNAKAAKGLVEDSK